MPTLILSASVVWGQSDGPRVRPGVLMRYAAVVVCVGLGWVTLTAATGARQTPGPAGPVPAPPVTPVTSRTQTGPAPTPAPTRMLASDAELLKTYCVTCHNDRAKTGGLSLASFDVQQAAAHPEVAEQIVRKLTAGMMPPAGARRPEDAALRQFRERLETVLDQAAARRPNPGWRPFQRLTRTEYAEAVKDLLDLEIDATVYLPPDTSSHGFDNLSDAQSLSPTLFEGYLRAASQISRLAVGDRGVSALTTTYRIPQYESQMRQVEGAPFGSRGGLSVTHNFPADGTYVFTAMMVRTVSGELFGNTAVALANRDEPIYVLVNGEPVATMRVHSGMSDADERGMSVRSDPVHIKAGPQQVSVVFPRHFAGPVDDLLIPIDSTLIDTRIGTGFGVTALPHIQDVAIQGPLQVSGVSETPSRRRVFTCRPTSAAEEERCAVEIAQRLVARAYRGTGTPEDLQDVMKFYADARSTGGFEEGVRLMVQGVLASPRFVFRTERMSRAATPGGAVPVGDLEMASRLSFFLWGRPPDDLLLEAARQRRLSTRPGLTAEVQRMLNDPRAEALATRFGSQWLRLQDVDKIRPDGLFYPYWDRSLSQALRRETELFFASIVRENRSVLDLLTADYSFVNERVARHYGIPNVTGDEFRRVTLPPSRRGLLGHGSILMLTSVADRTSPVQRGKYVMQVLLNSPPPPPPPNVPPLEATDGADGGRVLSVRERMEAHRKNPACTSCHRVIDPLGLALENFDVTGRWRLQEKGSPIDTRGQLFDGSAVDGPEGLRTALLKYKETVLRGFTESLMTYALGRQLTPADMPRVRAIVREAAADNYRASTFILGVVRSPAFRMMGVAAEPKSTDAAGGGAGPAR